jgi:phosphoglycolate phosphatase
MGQPHDRLIVCDLDGTMADTLPGIAHSIQNAMRQFGFREPTLEETRQNIGGGAKNLVRNILGPDHAELLDDVLKVFAADYNGDPTFDLTLYPGVKETLTTLAETTHLAIATAKAREATDKCLEFLDIARFFDPIITMSEMRAPKPDPGCVFDILEYLHITPERTMIVGDTPTDAKTARNAGVAVWVVPYGYGAERLLEQGGYDRMVDTFSDILEWSPAA